MPNDLELVCLETPVNKTFSCGVGEQELLGPVFRGVELSND